MVALRLLTRAPPMLYSTLEPPTASHLFQCESPLLFRDPSHSNTQLQWLKVVFCLVCLCLMVGPPSQLADRADAADAVVVPSITHAPTYIERISPIQIATPVTRAATATHYSPITPGANQSPIPWDFYLDNTWSIIGGDVAQTLASAVQDLQLRNGAQLRIEAYCDDRDSSAYSLVIGDRWLSKVESYLISLGATPSNFSTISFGKERLLCQDSTGQCWEANLRMRESFRLMAIDQAEQGCLIRVNQAGDQLSVLAKGNLYHHPILQRLHISLPVRSSAN